MVKTILAILLFYTWIADRVVEIGVACLYQFWEKNLITDQNVVLLQMISSSIGLASAAEQLQMKFAPLQTSLTCNWTPSGGSAKDENSLCQYSDHHNKLTLISVHLSW